MKNFMKKHGATVMRVWRVLNALFIAFLANSLVDKFIMETVLASLLNKPRQIVTMMHISTFVVMAFIVLTSRRAKNDEWRLNAQLYLIGACFINLWIIFGAGSSTAIWSVILVISVCVENILTAKYRKITAKKKKRCTYTPKEDGGFN